jgi:hypothetical protein
MGIHSRGGELKHYLAVSSYLIRGSSYGQEARAERGRVVMGSECKMFVDPLAGSSQFEVRRLSDQALNWALVTLVWGKWPHLELAARVSGSFLAQAHRTKMGADWCNKCWNWHRRCTDTRW